MYQALHDAPDPIQLLVQTDIEAVKLLLAEEHARGEADSGAPPRSISVSGCLANPAHLGVSIVTDTQARVFISAVERGGAVDLEGSVTVGDELIEFCGVAFDGLSHDAVLQVMSI